VKTKTRVRHRRLC